MARINPVEPPYEPEVAARLAAMMPPGVEPIGLFRTFVTNLPMATAMGKWGGYELSKQLSLSLRHREIVIDRTCARCGCEYEWGVHVAFFAERAQLTPAQVSSLTHGSSTDSCWESINYTMSAPLTTSCGRASPSTSATSNYST
jgi:Carboxymuconolactone decarboxylase family